ncbi:pyridoxamine 5'-phosphate oxidase family protein [Microbacterium sp. M28]|uniref:pyridoxine/pyridoxamine 5'-phosphate oxidase n=1 Tax=Microbacterium sp. M28 TaxID=2962064 RepID=UPI0021F3DAD0|nr:pyridoxamine 5'-phosphate oxidase family protein [Microbacterium sp. M28]UYO96012.1 pyridoxamine 5'-phosphate oxidase family protein [Microbacterium sp. M28]
MTTSPADWLRGLPSLTGTPPDPDPAAVPDDPETLFVEWIVGAVQAGVPEPHAMTLATVDAEGAPDARTVILKDVGGRGWAFAGHRASRKAEQLAARPVAALDFWWQPVMRAVRVRGSVVQADAADSAADLAARSPAARDGIAPEDWLLWRLVPDRVEFWQGAVDRRHLRLVYERTDTGWTHRIATGHTEPQQSGERIA